MSGITEARLEAAAAVRELVHALAAHDADDEALRDVARGVRALVPAVAAAPRRSRALPTFADIQPTTLFEHETETYAMADRAVVGPANPTAVDMRVRREGNEGVAEVVFGPEFEGALGRVHGGMVAAVFDDLAGFALALAREPGFSVRLDVSFRAPVPIETPVEMRARLRERRGRKLLVEGEARLDGQVLATMEAVMVTVDQEHFETHAHELLGRRSADGDG